MGFCGWFCFSPRIDTDLFNFLVIQTTEGRKDLEYIHVGVYVYVPETLRFALSDNNSVYTPPSGSPPSASLSALLLRTFTLAKVRLVRIPTSAEPGRKLILAFLMSDSL